MTVKDFLEEIKYVPEDYEIMDWSNGVVKQVQGVAIVCDETKSIAFSTDIISPTEVNKVKLDLS